MRSTRAAIIDAAVARFAQDGFATSLRTIAADAGVSAALIVHHFGSKEGLRAAVDDNVLAIADDKVRLLEEQGAGAAAAMIVTLLQDGHVPRYVARVLVDGGDAGIRLFASFVDVTEKSLLELNLAEPRMTAALLVTHSLGALVMAEHVRAATGDDLFSATGLPRFAAAAVAIYQGAVAPLIPS